MVKTNRILCLLLALCLLAGCANGGTTEPGAGKGATGRYMETLLHTLGEDDRLAGSYIDANGDLIFYLYRWNEEGGVWRGVLKKDSATPQLSLDQPLSDLVAEGGRLSSISFSGSDIWALVNDASYNTTLVHSTDGVTYQTVEVPGWSSPYSDMPRSSKGDENQEEEEEGAGMGFVSFGSEGLYPYGVIALPESFLILYGEDGVYEYDKTGNLHRTFEGYALRNLTAYWDGRLAIADWDTGEITLYNLETGESSAAGTYDNMSFDTYLGLDDQGIFLADSLGIFRLNEDWERIVDGGLTSLMYPAVSVDGLYWSNGAWVALLDGDEMQLMRYAYDPNMPAEPEITLELFSLRENTTVRQAIGEMQRKNPNVRVNMEIGLTDEGGAELEDVIRALNTRLIAGKGPDLLVLDGLPIDSLIEKNVLADLSGLVGNLSGSQNLLNNMMQTYARGDNIYGVPARFTLPVMLGDLGLMGGVDSLSALADLAQGWQGESKLLTRPDNLWMPEGILMDYYDACAHLFTKEDGSINEAALADYFTAALRLNTLLRNAYPEIDEMSYVTYAIGGSAGFEVMDMGSWTLMSGDARLHTTTLGGMMGLKMIAQNLLEQPEMGLNSLFGTMGYQPTGGVGMVAATGQPELALQFIETLLSPAVQNKYLYDGFPVDSGALAAMLKEYMVDDDDEEPISDLGFEALSHKLARPVFIDLVVKQAVEEQTLGLMEGTLTPEQAAANVVESTRLYLAE